MNFTECPWHNLGFSLEQYGRIVLQSLENYQGQVSVSIECP